MLRVLEPQISEAIDCEDPSAHVLAAAAFLRDQKLIESLPEVVSKLTMLATYSARHCQPPPQTVRLKRSDIFIEIVLESTISPDIALSLKRPLSTEYPRLTLHFRQQQ